MAAMSLDNVMKDSPTYFPILRSVLKSQIQFLVEQLCDAGEETLIISANVSDGEVEQLGSESGKLFVEVYDDFKSEFLGFCQRRKGKRKLESPQKRTEDSKRGKVTPAVLSALSAQNVPKVSSARVIVSQKPSPSSRKATVHISSPGSQVVQVASDQATGTEELGDTEEELPGDTEDTGLGYAEMEDLEEEWQESSDGTEMPSSSQDQSASSQDQTIDIKVKSAATSKTTTHKGTKVTSFVCEQCYGSYTTKTSLKRHIIEVHEKDSDRYPCSQCERSYGTRQGLQYHFSKHGERNFQCDRCQLLLFTEDELIEHRKEHNTEDGKYDCAVCGNIYRTRQGLQYHVRKHGERNFKCDTCFKLCFTMEELLKHERQKHSNEVKLPSQEQKDQNSPINLQRMFRKAMSCTECGKLFIRADALKIHMLSHTGENPYTCRVCGMGLKKKRSYLLHMAKKHPEIEVNDD